jgi:hypothetical protein
MVKFRLPQARFARGKAISYRYGNHVGAPENSGGKLQIGQYLKF